MIIILCLSFIVISTSFTTTAAYSINDTPLKVKKGIIQVELILHTLDERDLNSIILDNGERLGDYEYIITTSNARINTTLGNYFTTVAWITRDSLISLSLNPKINVRTNYYTKETAWNVLSDPNVGFGNHANFIGNETTLKNQYDCHFNNAFYKHEWNIEPSRPVVDWQTMLLSGCNPE